MTAVGNAPRKDAPVTNSSTRSATIPIGTLGQARMMMSIFGAALCLLMYRCGREFFGVTIQLQIRTRRVAMIANDGALNWAKKIKDFERLRFERLYA
jgi:hypothetical protein